TEIPEIAEGIVQVKGAAREPGERAKLAVASTKRDVDPIGACVGLRGTRIQVIVRGLRGEKIYIIEWSDDVPTLVARALSPAKVASVTVQGEGEERSALVVVPDNQLSLAIGKKGQNARLAARLTGLRIDVKSESELEEERRRHEDERARGLAALAELAPVDAHLAEVLATHGLESPAKIKAAGAAGLREIAGLGEREADAVVAAAEEWLASRQPDTAAATPPVLVEGAADPATGGEPPAETGQR
ncbi:MAG: transcription termination/antitermination protein NusA, partial [Candidatus Rokubacteria bacterium]|nr:transcription termination/antitermination protein NusA [Candidatus Rokubacteria bacterium]